MVKLYLVADEIETRIQYRDWYEALHLAQRYGWEPAGTIIRGRIFKCDCTWQGGPMCHRCQKYADAWPGDYLRRRCQLVTDADAAWLAGSLDAAVRDVPTEAPPWRYADLDAHESLPIYERLTEDLLGYWASHEQGTAVLDSILLVAGCGEFRIH